MAKKKSPEQRLVDALSEILTKDQLSKMLFALIKQQTTEALIEKANRKDKTKQPTKLAPTGTQGQDF